MHAASHQGRAIVLWILSAGLVLATTTAAGAIEPNKKQMGPGIGVSDVIRAQDGEPVAGARVGVVKNGEGAFFLASGGIEVGRFLKR